MALLNFQKQFAEKVRSGEKTQTIRSIRKNPIKKGDRLYLYTGLRTKSTQKLKEALCTGVISITIDKNYMLFEGANMIACKENLNELAKEDGFKDWNALIKWFNSTHGIPFKGVLILWE
jgi:hypothetical protein